MANVFIFMHVRSDKGLARQSKSLSRDVDSIIEKVKALEHKITYVEPNPEKIEKEGGDIQRGDVKAVVNDVTALINDITGEERDLQQIEKDSAELDYDLLKQIGRIESELESIQRKKGTQELSGEIQKLHNLSSQIQGLINKARIDARNARLDREKIMKYRAYLGYHQVAIDIKNTENEIRSMIGKEKSAEADIRNHATLPNLLKKDVDEFIKAADIESRDIYKVEYDDIIFTFYVLNKLEVIAQILTKLKNEGFEEKHPDEQKLLEGKYFQAKALMEEATKEAQKMERYMQTRAHKLAA